MNRLETDIRRSESCFSLVYSAFFPEAFPQPPRGVQHSNGNFNRVGKEEPSLEKHISPYVGKEF